MYTAFSNFDKKNNESEEKFKERKEKVERCLKFYTLMWLEKSTSVTKTETQILRLKLLNSSDFLVNSP
jgi:hypothetical protein